MTTATPGLEPIARITRQIRDSARMLSDDEARYLVDAYYQVQDFRKASANQIRSIRQERDEGDVQVPFLDWTLGSFEYVEATIKNGLDRYTNTHPVGRWSKSIVGIGPVIAAGLLAHLSGRDRTSVGQIWRFAGLDPTVEWKRGEKRPWNARLKTLCWHAGESFVKVQGNPNDVYGKVYRERKAYEWRKNLAGEYGDQARARIGQPNWNKMVESRKWWEGYYQPFEEATIDDILASPSDHFRDVGEGKGIHMLPPAAIHERAKRVAVKLFLSHWFHVWYEVEHGTPPPSGPYAISILGHSGYMPPPNWPMD